MGGNTSGKTRNFIASAENSSESNGLNKDKDHLLPEDVQVMEKAWMDLYKVADVYQKAYSKLAKAKTEFMDFHKTKMTTFESKITENRKRRIKKLMEDYDEESKKIKSTKDTTKAEYETAKRSYEKAQILVSEMEKDFELKKGYLQDIEKKQKGIDGIKETLDKSDANNNLAHLSWLLWDFKDSLEDASPMETQDLKSQLVDNLNALSKAKNDFRKYENEKDVAKTKLDFAEERLKLLKQNRRVAIMKEMATVEG